MQSTQKILGILILIFTTSFAWADKPILLKSMPAYDAFSTTLQDEKREAGLYILQWRENFSKIDKAELKSQGIELLQYLPEDAYLANVADAGLEQLTKMNSLEDVVPYQGVMKMEQGLNRHGIFSFADTRSVVLQTLKDATFTELKKYFSGEFKKVGEGIFTGTTSVSLLWDLAKRSDVLWIEKHVPVKSMALSQNELLEEESTTDKITEAPTYTGYESGVKIMNLESVYADGMHGEGSIVAMADTGLDSGEISSLVADFEGQVIAGFAMGLFGTSWADPNSHGTHVAGSIVGNGALSDGNIVGAAFAAKFVAQGLWSDLLNNISLPDAEKLLKNARDAGATIHSDSWGMASQGRYDAMTAKIDKFHFENQDFLAVFAAGNSGVDMDRDGVIDEGSVASPGGGKNVLTVGASKNYLLEGGIQRQMKDLREGEQKWGVEPIASSRLSDDANGMAAFSSRGPTQDGRIKPDVVAPGTNIVSVRSRHPEAGLGWGKFTEDYLYMGGTSMATPLTSGALAVLAQILRKKTGDEKFSGALLKASVVNGATDLYPGQFGEREQGQEQPTTRPNNHQGWGRVNMDYYSADKLSKMELFDEKSGLAAGGEKIYKVQLGSEVKDFRLTLAYTDAPGSPAAAKALVNDLDLELVAPNGDIFYPNGGNSPDRKNNLEHIDFELNQAGEYQVRVSAHRLAEGINGKQPYALVLSYR